MQYIFKVMNQSEAELIANHWHYEQPYDFYDMVNDKEDYEELVNPDMRSHYFSVYQGNDLFAFFTYSIDGHIVNIGLGINPLYVSKGYGAQFVQACIVFVNQPLLPVSLSVASFNQRAIRVYETCGIKQVKHFKQQTNGGVFDFIQMIKEQ